MPADPNLLDSAIQHHRKGDLLTARNLYLQVLLASPTDITATFQLGMLEMQQGRLQQALERFASATAIQPDHADALCNIGNCHKLLGDASAAELAYRKALQLEPNHARAMSNLATVIESKGDIDQAIQLLRAAVLVDPQNTTFAVNLGALLCRTRQYNDAQTLLGNALLIDPANAKAAYTLGNALHGLGKLSEAARLFSRAVSLRPNYANALNNLGNVHREIGESDAAVKAYESAIRAQPDFLPAINNASALLRTTGKLERAQSILRSGLEHHPNHPTLLANLGNVLKDCGQLDQAQNLYRKSLELDPNAVATHANLAYSLNFSSLQAQPILQECIGWNNRHAEPLRPSPLHFANDRSTTRRLRIGYVSPDFRDHCQALFLIPLLANHDHTEFEIFCYSSVEHPDEVTRRIQNHADVWRDVHHLDDLALADLVRSDRIDILVDLTLFMAGSRSLMFARKPAPVQIAWLAYPGTTGMFAMDYRFSDPRLDPPGYEKFYTEQTLRLPDSFWCYDPLTDEPQVNNLPALSTGQLTLGCLNNPCKLTDHTLRLWAPVMQALPTAHLLLLAPRGAKLDTLRARLNTHGISSDRVTFIPFQKRIDYLRTYHRIDLGLDTFPYNGHTTSFDSMWMGVPVVTRVGDTCVGRAGLSQLFHLRLTQLACGNDQAFVRTALDLASDLPRLSQLRQSLRNRLAQSPLMDGARFAQNVQAVYRSVWKVFCRDNY